MSNEIEYTTLGVHRGTGEIVFERTAYGGCRNGSGFCMMYTEKTAELVASVRELSTLRVFMLLAMGQDYGTDGRPFGMVTTKREVQQRLRISERSCIRAFNWLKEQAIIHERPYHGTYEFMVNPAYVTVGRDKDKRMSEWVERWRQSGLFLPGARRGTKSFSPSKSASDAG